MYGSSLVSSSTAGQNVVDVIKALALKPPAMLPMSVMAIFNYWRIPLLGFAWGHRHKRRMPDNSDHYAMNKQQSESWTDCREETCDMRVSFSLLTDSQSDGASPRDVAANEVLVFAPEFSGSSVLL
jgi:hypothetical protein